MTQEELAEAADISRVYYGMLESGRPVHVSSTVLGRIAQALMLDADERATLFVVAVPEMPAPNVSRQSRAVLDAFASLGPLMRRLWSAASEHEALTIVSEDCFTRFDRPAVVVFPERAGLGRWTLPVIIANADAARRTEAIFVECASALSPEQVDDLMSYGLVNEPGDVVLLSEHPYSQAIAAPFANAIGHAEWPHLDALLAHVRTRHGLVGQLAVLRSDRQRYSQTERAMLSTLANLTSLALN